MIVADAALETRIAVLKAAAELLQREGVGGVTTRAVAAAAGVQAPTIYRLFGDKDGLLDAVAEQVMAEYSDTKAALADAEDHQDPVAALHRAWNDHVEFGTTHPDLYRLMIVDSRRAESPAIARGAAVLRARIERVAAAGRLRVAVDRAVQIFRAAGTGVVLTLITTPVDRRDADLAATMFDAVHGAVITEPTGASSHPQRDSLDADLVAAVTFTTVAPRLPGLSDAERTMLTEWVDRAVSAAQQADRSAEPGEKRSTPQGGARARTRRSAPGRAD